MENASLYNEALSTMPSDAGPNVGELCTSCRHRIAQRYIPSLDPKEGSAGIIRLFIPVGDSRKFRKEGVCEAWRIARENNLFPSRNQFAEHASKIVHVSPRWILKWIEPKKSRPV